MKSIFVRVAQIASFFALLAMLLAVCSGEANAMTRKHSHKRVRIHKPDTRAFPPSRAALLAQNAAIDEMHLPRFRNDADLRSAITLGELMPVEETSGLKTAVPVDRRYLRPAALAEAYLLSYQFWLRFNQPLYLSSAVRTQQFQLRLRLWDHNAAPVNGPLESSHLAGTTFDIARKKLTREQTVWVENFLNDSGLIVEEESGQACFHIFVRG
jgi:hypothetical protein